MAAAVATAPAPAADAGAAAGTVHEGRFSYPDGATYVGQYVVAAASGKPVKHGHGRYVAANGLTSYEGEWRDDQMQGRGTFVGASGGVYTGQFDAGAFSGTGEYRWTDGAVYAGGWRASRMHGSGVYTSPDGVRWAGEFVSGLYSTGSALVSLR